MSEAKRFSVFKVVDAGGLQAATESGWSLVSVLSETTPQVVTEDTPVVLAGGGASGYVNASTVQYVAAQKQLVVHRALFLLARDDASLAALTARADELASRNAALEKALASTKGEIGSLERQLNEAKLDTENAHKARDYQRAEADGLRSTRDRLEAALSRIRVAVGEREMTRILSPADQPTSRSADQLPKGGAGR